jgi:hypothetical protein
MKKLILLLLLIPTFSFSQWKEKQWTITYGGRITGFVNFSDRFFINL